MEPTRNAHATLVDLLDRVLDKGLVINADIIISVAGIPLIGVNLRAALAGMETMIKYGMMQNFDAETRAWAREHYVSAPTPIRLKKEIPQRVLPHLAPAEKIIYEGKMWYLAPSQNILMGSEHEIMEDAWRPGYLYLTNERLCFWYEFAEKIIFEAALEKILAETLEIKDLSAVLKKKKILEVLYASNGDKKIAQFSGENSEEWEKILNKIIASPRMYATA